MKAKFLSGTMLLLFVWSCREVYYPDELYSDEKIPVIQGLILENNMPVVKISWAIKYKEEIAEPISGCIVSIRDDWGNFIRLNEGVDGTYYPEEYYLGMQGQSYSLSVEMPDGNIFVSGPQLLPPAPAIDSLYAKPVVKTTYVYNNNNEPVIDDQKGLNIYADMGSTSNDQIYYRFNTRLMKQMKWTDEMGSISAHPVYVWESETMDNSFTVGSSYAYGERQILLNHDIGFLHYYYDRSLETPTSTAPFTTAWVLTFKVYSISYEAYNYYNSIARQLVSDNQILAPVPSQVKSNIWCINNPSAKVIGVFEAASLTTVYKAFGWIDLKSYKSKELPFFPDNVPDGTIRRYPPDFWVYF